MAPVRRDSLQELWHMMGRMRKRQNRCRQGSRVTGVLRNTKITTHPEPWCLFIHLSQGQWEKHSGCFGNCNGGYGG